MPAIQYDSTAFTPGERYMLCVPQHLIEDHRTALEAFTFQLAHTGAAMTLHPFSENEMDLLESGKAVMGHELVWVRNEHAITQRGGTTHYLLEKASGDTCLTVVEER